MGCGSSKKTDVVDTTSRNVASTSQLPTTSLPTTEPAEKPAEEAGEEPAAEEPIRRERMPRGNVLKYSKWLKRFARLSSTAAGANAGSVRDVRDLGSVPFPLQDGVEPEDLTPWRDEDTRIVVQKVEQRVDPYFWDFSDNAQRKADEYFQEMVSRQKRGRLEISPARDTLNPYPNSWGEYRYQYDPPVPLNPASVEEYFRGQLRHPAGRCSDCIQDEMRFQGDGPALEVVPDFQCTPEQLEIWETRSRRQDLDDPERMRRRRIALIRRFLELYPEYGDQQEGEEIEENELQPWLGWADRMEESWQTFQDLLVVNSNESKNEETNALTRTTTLIL